MENCFATSDNCDLAVFATLCEQVTARSNYPRATEVVSNVVVYDGDSLLGGFDATKGNDTSALKSEWAHCLKDGPGALVIRRAFADLSVVDRSTELFRQIVADEQAAGRGRGDHFGSNERIWNSLQKVCTADPAAFVDYYSNPLLALACQAWLGPNYQITAQMNTVKPDGQAQSPHRDYHLGFQSAETVAQYPVHAQAMSQFLTLQGAVAHVDMPIESGPTLLLPFSHQYALGYLAYERAEFVEYFQEHAVQLPLAKGDLVFFNPALFHAGGGNSTDNDRVANLLQISAAFGRPMESIDRRAMAEAVYPVLLQRKKDGALSPEAERNAIAAVADGYSFPTNLDTDPPIDGNAPLTQQQLLQRALGEEWSAERLSKSLAEYEARRRA